MSVRVRLLPLGTSFAPDGEVCWLTGGPRAAPQCRRCRSVARATPRRGTHAVETRCVIGSASDRTDPWPSSVTRLSATAAACGGGSEQQAVPGR